MSETIITKRAVWEYKILNYAGIADSVESLEKLLNEFGADGWELVTIEQGGGVFKRFAGLEEVA